MSSLPSHWALVTLNELQADEPRAITDGPFGSNLTSAHYTDDGPRVVRLQNIGDGQFVDAKAHISPEHYETLRAHEVRAGDLLVASLGEDPPRACLAPVWLGPAIVKADCIRVRLRGSVEPRWVMYAMRTPAVRSWAADRTYGVGRPRLGLKSIRAIPVPVPPIEEQRRVLEVLEDHISRIDAAEAYLRSAGRAVSELRLAALVEHRQHVTENGARTEAIGALCTTTLGKMLDAKRAEGESTPYLRNGNVRWGAIDLTNILTVPLTASERSRLSLASGDLLVCEGGEPGRCAIWEGSGEIMTFQKALHRVRVRDSRVTTRYVAAMLEEIIRTGRADRVFTGTTIKHLPQEKLRALQIPVPELAVQARLVERLTLLEAGAGRMARQLDAALARASALRRSLMTAAFSGRLLGETEQSELAEGLARV